MSIVTPAPQQFAFHIQRVFRQALSTRCIAQLANTSMWLRDWLMLRREIFVFQ